MSSPHDPNNPQPAWNQGDPQQQPWGQPDPNRPTGAPQYGQPDQPQYGQPDQPQYGQPQYGQPPYGQPQYGQPEQPQYGQPGQPQYGQPGQPQYGQPEQPQYGQPPYGQPQQPWAQDGGQPPQGPGYPTAAPDGPAGGPPKKNKGVIITAVAVVVALLAGLGVYFFAFRDSGGGGQATPEAAAAQLFADVDNGDLIGLTDTFDPVEAQFVNDFATDVIEQFKRLGLVTDDATVNNATGANISIKGITFDAAAEEKPLPDLTIVKLTGGTLTVNPSQSTGTETDLYQQLVDAITAKASAEDIPMSSTTEPTVIDIAQVIRDDNNGEPIRISTVLRDGNWYPSMFYTAADYWAQTAGVGAVTTGDKIDAKGAASPAEAVDGMIKAAIAHDATGVIQLLPPDEMAAVQTYGKKIVDAIGTPSSAAPDVTLDAEWNESDVTGGKLLSIKTLSFTSGDESGTIEIDQAAGSITVTDGTDTQTFDADSIAELIGTGELAEIHPNMTDFVQRMLKAALGLGVVTTETDGQWYVSPLRSYSGMLTTLLGGMEQRDIEMFIELLQQ